jgi:hypothetical protein
MSGTKFIDKNLSRKTVPGTPVLPLKSFADSLDRELRRLNGAMR